jgi:hypothetical protein
LEDWGIEIVETIRREGLSMCSVEDISAVVTGCTYVSRAGIKGSFVECGVWRGGMGIAAALTFQHLEDNRSIYLFDTYEGMTMPTEHDQEISSGRGAVPEFKRRQQLGQDWCLATLDDVQTNFDRHLSTLNNVHFIQGPVESTLCDAANLPGEICVLRLDTDWYESSKFELMTLEPLVSQKGIIFLDDYGHWAGQKLATDEYFEEIGIFPRLSQVSRGGREILKHW